MKRIAAVIIIILFLVPFFYHFFRYFKENINQRKEVVSGKQQFVEDVSKVPVASSLKDSKEESAFEEEGKEPDKTSDKKVANTTQTTVEKNKPREQKYESKVQDEILYYRLNSKEHIKKIQVSLKKAGFYKGEIDGKMGPRTKRAIKEFQKAKKLNPDGVVGGKTWEALEKYLRN